MNARTPFVNAVNMHGISVIIPSYKADMRLIDAIDSVYCQKLDSNAFEVIVIDDKFPSGDARAKAEHERVFEEIEKRRLREPEKYANLRVIESGDNHLNNGVSRARNAAIEAAKFEFIVGLDADDMYVFDPDFLDEHGSYLERAMHEMKTDPGLAYVDCGIYMFGAGTNNSTLNPSIPSEDLHIARVQNMAISNIAVFRKQDAIAAGGYDETLRSAEDTHFFIKILAARVDAGCDTKLMTLEQPYYLYRQYGHGEDHVSSFREDFNLSAYIRKVVEDGFPYFRREFGNQPPEEITDLLLKRRMVYRPLEDKTPENPQHTSLLKRMGIDLRF